MLTVVSLRGANLRPLLVLGALAGLAWIPGRPPAAPLLPEDAPKPEQALDRQINLVYTVNNLGYTDTCG